MTNTIKTVIEWQSAAGGNLPTDDGHYLCCVDGTGDVQSVELTYSRITQEFITIQPPHHICKVKYWTHMPVVMPEATTAEAAFERFWAAYPNKVGKIAAKKAFMKLSPDTDLFGQIMKSLEWQKTTERWQREGGRYIPNPLTWLNQGRWENQPVELNRRVNENGFEQGSFDTAAFFQAAIAKSMKGQ